MEKEPFKTTPAKKLLSDESVLHSVRIHAKRNEEEGWHTRALYAWEIADRYEILLERAKVIMAMAEERLNETGFPDDFVQFVHQHLGDAIEGR